MDLKDKQKAFVLNEDLSKVMWKLSLPAIAAMVLFGLNAFMDTVYIGQLLDPAALSGVAIAYPLTSIMMGLGAWAGTGGGNILSVALGKNDEATQKKILSNATLFVLLTTTIFAVPAYFFAEDMIAMMGGRGKVLSFGAEYFKIALLASPLWTYGLTLNFIVRAEGRMKEAALMMGYGLLLNLVLTPIFIEILNMGVAGAAWATNIGILVYCIVGYCYFKRGKASFNAEVNSLAYDAEVFKSIAKMGFPGFIMTAMSLVQAIVVFNAIVGFGTERDLAFFAAGNRIMLFLMTPLFGLMRALQPVAGINFGAKQYSRVKSAYFLFCRTGVYIVTPFWLALSLFPDFSLSLVLPGMAFTADEILNFRVYALVIPVLPIVFMSLTYLPAIEQPKYASIVGTARQVVFYVPAMLLLPKWVGISGVYYGSTAIDILLTAWLFILVWRTFSSFKEDEGEKVFPEAKASL